MPDDTLDSIKDMFDEASADEKNRFLFKALHVLSRDVKDGFKNIDKSLAGMKSACECRKTTCASGFVTKKQARVFGIMLALFAAGVGVGSGTIAWFELIKIVKP